MSITYISAPPKIITNDFRLAAYLLSCGCHLELIKKNDRRRLSFVLSGQGIHDLRRAYRTGRVCIDIRSFWDHLKHVRQMMDAEQRSTSCPRESRKRQSAA